MKATTLIFIVLVALGLWYLFNYMNKNGKLTLAGKPTASAGCGVIIDQPATTLPTKPVATPMDAFAEPVVPIIAAENPVPVTYIPVTSSTPTFRI